jgi:hypothetical protein
MHPKKRKNASVTTGRRATVDDARDTDARDQPGDGNGREDFLSRWSRRKRADGKAAEQPAARTAATAVGMPSREVAPEVDEGPLQELTDADMPPLDSLDRDSDFSVFMSPGVSEQLRTQALRKLFHLPAFNVTDGLNDYDEDYTQFAGLGNLVTQEMQRMLKRELQAGIEPETEPVVTSATRVEPADTESTADFDEGDDEDPCRPSGLS